jgi:predicted O-methyltransferase YrrM
MKTLLSEIQKLIKKCGIETADNIVAGMLLVHKDYFKLTAEIERYLKEN